MWDVVTGTLVRRYEGGLSQTDGVAFAPDGKALAVAGADDSGVRVVLWDVEVAR